MKGVHEDLLSPNSVSLGGGIPVQPSEILCTHVRGLQVAVAVAVGLEGVPLGGKGLELPIPTLAVVVVVDVVRTAEVVVIVGVSIVALPVVVGVSSRDLACTTCSCPFSGAKKCLEEAKASSWLAP